ncbi:MAG: ABC transporter substrate-binding protein [Chloroflexota bacterium]
MSGQLEPVRCGYVPVLIYTPLLLARELGYYRSQGIEVHLERLDTGQPTVSNLLAGSFDIAAGGPGPDFWHSIAEGHDLRIIAPMHAERPPAATPLIARADLFDRGEVDTVGDLHGRPVAAPSRGVPLFWLAAALESGGLTIDDVELRVVPYAEVGPAFERGEIDAAILGEPLVADLIERGLAARLASDFVDGLQPTYLYTTAENLQNHRAEITRFVTAYLMACDDLESRDPQRDWNAPATVRLISSFTDVPDDEVEESMHPTFEPEATFHEGSLERLYEFFIARGAIQPIPNFKPSSLIDRSVATEALERRRATRQS